MKRVFFGYCPVYCLYCLHKHHVLRNDLWLCWLISRQHLNIIFESSWNFGHLFNIVESYWLWYSSKRHCFYSWDSTFLLYLSSQSVLHNLPHPFIALFFFNEFFYASAFLSSIQTHRSSDECIGEQLAVSILLKDPWHAVCSMVIYWCFF